MKTILLDRNGHNIEIKRMDQHLEKITMLVDIHNNNPVKGLSANYESLIDSEIFNTLFTEGHISSRRQIQSATSSNLRFSNDSKTDNYICFAQNYVHLIGAKPDISVSSLFSIYNNMASNWVEGNSKLEDGHMFRHEMVYIASNSIKEEFKGFEVENIASSIKLLSEFSKDKNINIYIRAIMSHLYFEIIHPYFDLNGRVGRFIPFWIFNNAGAGEDMMYFSNAVGNYKDTYLKAFKDSIDNVTHKINADRFIEKILDLLILNQRQYLWYDKTKNLYFDNTKKKLSQIQKHLIWSLMIKSETQGNSSSWNKLSKNDMDYIEVEMKGSQFSRDSKILQEAKIIDITDTRPPRYKLLNYELLSK